MVSWLVILLLVVCLQLPAQKIDQVSVYPGENIQDVVSNHPPGTRFLLLRGVHRLQAIEPKAGNAFVGQTGTVLSGARLLTDFQKTGINWVAAVEGEHALSHGICQPAFPACSLSEDLFVDDTPRRRVVKLADVKAGTWYFDYAANRIYLPENPSGKKVELSVLPHAFYGSAPDVTIRGLIIEKYAAPAQQGAIHAREGSETFSNNWVVEGNEIRFNHGSGIRIGNRMKVIKNFIHHNGQLGVGESGSDVLIDGNEVAYNNAAGFDATWEAGGVKVVATIGLTVSNNYVHHNAGSGLWTDIDAINTTYIGNTVVLNEGPGIHHEISYKAVIRKNIVKDNGLSRSEWLWGAQILLQNARDVEVSENIVEVGPATGNGIAIINQDRGSGPLGSYDARNNSIHHNQITYRGTTTGKSGLVADHGEQAALAGNNRFDYNTYNVPNATAQYWQWQDSSDWSAFTKLGNEVNGKRIVYSQPAGSPAK